MPSEARKIFRGVEPARASNDVRHSVPTFCVKGYCLSIILQAHLQTTRKWDQLNQRFVSALKWELHNGIIKEPSAAYSSRRRYFITKHGFNYSTVPDLIQRFSPELNHTKRGRRQFIRQLMSLSSVYNALSFSIWRWFWKWVNSLSLKASWFQSRWIYLTKDLQVWRNQSIWEWELTNQNYVHKTLKRGLPLEYGCEYLNWRPFLYFLIPKK
jgi:hypothetical protein